MFGYFNGLKRYGDFNGRSTRSQYWMFVITLVILILLAIGADQANGSILEGQEGGIVTAIVWLSHVIPLLAVTVRRMHDIDRSGWWMWIQVIPVIGWIMFLIWACTASTPGTNRFGPPVGTRREDARQQPIMGQATRVDPALTATAVPSVSMLDQLEKLSALRASGAIDESEFQAMKADLIKRGVER